MARKLFLAALISLTLPLSALAQNVPEPELGDRLINLPTHLSLPPSTLQVIFTHRFGEAASGAAGDLFGLDSAADIGIGLEMGFGHGIEGELYRSSLFKQYETSIKWTALRQGESSRLGMAIRVGSEYRGVSGLTDRWAGFAQVVLSRRVAGTLDLFVVPMYATDTPTLRNAKNVGFGASLRLAHACDLSAEVIPVNHDTTTDASFAWAAAFTKRVRGHAFLIYFGNSRATTADLMTASDLPGGFKGGDLRLGFNLVRRFPE